MTSLTPQTSGDPAHPIAGTPAKWPRSGAKVEVRIDEDGFRGAWYEATVRRCLGRGRFQVAYATLVSDLDPSEPLVEAVRLPNLRPCPLSGVLYGGKYKVAFPTTREEIAFAPALMRPMFRWSDDSVGATEEEAEDSVFIVGADIEVSRERANFGNTWFPAQVKKVISNTVYLVEYRNLKKEGRDNESLTEIVDAQNIRPLQTVDLCIDFSIKDEVEVYLEGGWSPGAVTRILEYSGYTVILDHHEEEMEFNKSALRPRCQWNGSEWILTRKRKTKESGSGKRSVKRRQTSFGNKGFTTDSGVAPESDSFLDNHRKTDDCSPGNQSECAKPSSGLKEKNIESNGILRDNFFAGGLTECNEDQTVESYPKSKTVSRMLEIEKEPDGNFFLDGVSKEVLKEQQLIDMVPEVPLQHEVQLVIDAEKSIYLSKTPQVDILSKHEEFDYVQLAEWRNYLISNSGGLHRKKGRKKLFVRRPETKFHTDAAYTNTMGGSGSPEQHIDGIVSVECFEANSRSLPLGLPRPIEASIKENDNVSPRKESREIMVRCDKYLMHMPSKNIQPPFLKNDDLWKELESMELFKKLPPQQPHFQPLEKYAMEFREGLAIGLMISFVNLVSSVQQLQVVDPETTIKGKFELLDCLEEHGFNIQFLRLQLENLLEFQACQKQFESKKSLLSAQIFEKNKDNAMLRALIMNLDNDISEMEQKLKQAYDERSSLYMQRKKNDAEICVMEKDLSDAEKANNSAADSFFASLDAFL